MLQFCNYWLLCQNSDIMYWWMLFIYLCIFISLSLYFIFTEYYEYTVWNTFLCIVYQIS